MLNSLRNKNGAKLLFLWKGLRSYEEVKDIALKDDLIHHFDKYFQLLARNNENDGVGEGYFKIYSEKVQREK